MEQKNNWVIWKYLSLIRNTELIPEMQTWSHFLTAKKKKKKKKKRKKEKKNWIFYFSLFKF